MFILVLIALKNDQKRMLRSPMVILNPLSEFRSLCKYNSSGTAKYRITFNFDFQVYVI